MSKGTGRELIGFIPLLIFVIFALVLFLVFGTSIGEAFINSIKAVIKIIEVK